MRKYKFKGVKGVFVRCMPKILNEMNICGNCAFYNRILGCIGGEIVNKTCNKLTKTEYHEFGIFRPLSDVENGNIDNFNLS